MSKRRIVRATMHGGIFTADTGALGPELTTKPDKIMKSVGLDEEPNGDIRITTQNKVGKSVTILVPRVNFKNITVEETSEKDSKGSGSN